MNNRSNVFIGLIFVLLGGVFLLKNLNILYFDVNIGFIFAYFWPMFLLIPGLMMHYSFLRGGNSDPGILVPGGILLVTGATCQLSMLFNIWHLMWPGFILAVAVGLFELYLFGTRDKALLIPVGILGGLSFIFFTSFSLRWVFHFNLGPFIVPAALILLGVLIISKNNRR